MKGEKNKLIRSPGNTCLTECVARYFNINCSKVPFFIGYGRWTVYLKRFFRRRGLNIEHYPYKKSLLSNKRKLYLVVGLSQRSKTDPRAKRTMRNVYHSVLYRGTKPYYDPNGGGLFLKGRPDTVWIVTKIKK